MNGWGFPSTWESTTQASNVSPRINVIISNQIFKNEGGKYAEQSDSGELVVEPLPPTEDPSVPHFGKKVNSGFLATESMEGEIILLHTGKHGCATVQYDHFICVMTLLACNDDSHLFTTYSSLCHLVRTRHDRY